MNEFRMDDPFPPTPEGFHLRMERTLSGLKEEPMRRRHRLGTAILIAAVILTLAFGAALATGYFKGEIDWFGQLVREEGDMVAPTEEPGEAELSEEETRNDRADDILDGQPEGEYWIVEYEDGSGMARGCLKTFDSLAMLNEFLRASTTDFRLLEEAPEGYMLYQAYCEFYYTKEIVEHTEVTEEDVGDGMTLVKIKLDDEMLPRVGRYSVDFRNTQGQRVSVSGNLTEVKLKDFSFGVYEDDVYETLDIDGMKGALYFDRGEYRKLSMIEETSKARGYTSLFSRESILDGSESPATFKYIDYDVWSDGLARDELIELATSLK